MAVSTITKKGQTTIPKAIREKLGLKPYDKIIYIIEGDEVKIQGARRKIEKLYGSFPVRKGKKPIDFEEVRDKFQEGVAQDIIKEMKWVDI